jgi:hypothetical protein
MVELLQALAWAIKGDDRMRATANRNGELRNFMVGAKLIFMETSSGLVYLSVFGGLLFQASYLTGVESSNRRVEASGSANSNRNQCLRGMPVRLSSR